MLRPILKMNERGDYQEKEKDNVYLKHLVDEKSWN
jgi:hypothetical protein